MPWLHQDDVHLYSTPIPHNSKGGIALFYRFSRESELMNSCCGCFVTVMRKTSSLFTSSRSPDNVSDAFANAEPSDHTSAKSLPSSNNKAFCFFVLTSGRSLDIATFFYRMIILLRWKKVWLKTDFQPSSFFQPWAAQDCDRWWLSSALIS